MKEKEEPIKDKHCIKCEQFFDCAGNDPHIKDCLNYKERKQEADRWKRKW